nr:restriction endonuclease subunit S [uncultured Haemophilus sp.]
MTWEQCKAEDVFISISEKNHETFPVLSATQDKGMISRNEVGIDIKYDVNSLKTYKLVRKDQFVIHLRSFQGGFAHSAIDGITSPAYTILDFKDKRIHSPLFWREIFKSDFFIKRLESVIYGIRDGRSISYDEFLKLNFNYPSFEEQTQIGNFFKQLDDTIALHQRELEKFKILKTSYLEHIFLGKVSLFTAKNTITWEQRKLGGVGLYI